MSKGEVALRKETELRKGKLCRGFSQVDFLSEESKRRNLVVERSLSEASPRTSEDVADQADDLDGEVEVDIVKLTQLVSLQQATYERVWRASIADDNPREADHHGTATQSSPNLQKMRPYQYEDMKSLKKGIFNPSRMHNACDVANKKAIEKARQERFQRRRRQCMNEELKKNEELMRVHEAADQCVVKRQHELFEKQAIIVNAAQQKRNEQQKVLHENWKNEEAEEKRLNLHREPTTEFVGKASESLRRGIQQVSKISPEAAAEPVYREMLESHSVYDSTLTRWTNFVKENERRTEVYRLKFVGEEPKKKKDRSSSKNIFRKAVDNLKVGNVSGIRKLFSKSAGDIDCDIQADTCTVQPGSAIEAVRPSAMENEWIEEGFSSSLMSSHLITSTVSSPSSPGAYAARLERMKRHHLEMEEKARQKLESDQQFLEEKRQMGKSETNKRASKAKDYVNAWEERCGDYVDRRESLNTSSDAEIVQKLANQKLDEELQRAAQDQDLFETGRSRQLKRETTKDTAQQGFLSRVQSFKEKHEDREIKSTTFKERTEAANKRTSQQGLDERVKEMTAKKKADEQEFKKSTMQAIERKQKRNDHAKALRIRPANPDKAFARLRLCKAESGSSPKRDQPPELTLIPGWSMPDDCKESPEGYHRLFTKRLDASDEVSPCPSPYHDASPFGKNEDDSPWRRTLKVRKASKTSSGADCRSPTPSRPTAMSLLSPGTPMTAEKGVDSRLPSKCSAVSGNHPDSDDDDDDDGVDSETNFLVDLESRAQKWLGGLRGDK